jgi:hypothetical protein
VVVVLVPVNTEYIYIYINSSKELFRNQVKKRQKIIKIPVHPKVSGLAAWSENFKWYSSLPLGAVVSLFYESV